MCTTVTPQCMEHDAWDQRPRLLVLQVKGENKEFNVKRLNKRPMPPRFGKKLSPKQLELASHICLDCGYIYSKPYVPSQQLGAAP